MVSRKQNEKRIAINNPLLKTIAIRILGCCAGLILFFFLLTLLFPLPQPKLYSTIITDDEGKVIHAFLTADDKWRMKTELGEISPLLQKAIVEKEDKWFYRHPGLNPVAMVRAFFNNLFTGRRTSGASTITMQVARALEPKQRTYANKFIEMFRALQLEMRYSKKEILQLYLNTVPYGGNIEGVKSAAVLYFRKNPDHLSLAEVVALSVIPNRPSSLVIGKTNNDIIVERNRWLKKFEAEGVFPATEIRDAMDEPLTATRLEAPKEVPHLSWKLKSSGNDIQRTWINLNTQWKAEKLVKDYVRTLQFRDIHQAAVMVVDNRNHHVIAYVGSADFADTTDAGQVNGAAAIRQPGSTLKPFLYGKCIDAGLLTPRMVLADAAVNVNGYAPENYDRQLNGYVTMEYALEHSLNIPAVKALRMLGKDAFVEDLSDVHFRQIQKDRRKLGLSLILGGCGATLEELTALFAGLSQEGKYQWPEYTQPGHDPDKKAKAVTQQMLSPAAAFLVNDILSKVNRPDFPLSWTSTEKMPKIAWKTGTSYGRRDAWSIGYNKHFTIGVWVGNFSGKGVPSLSGAEVATPLLFRLFNTIDYDSGKDWFEAPASLSTRSVCTATGLPPGPHCTETVSDWFIPLVSSTQTCQHMQEIAVNPEESISYCRICQPLNGYRKKLYAVIDPDMQAWMQDHHVAYQHIPPHNPDCESVFRGGAPRIVSPSNGGEYLIYRKNPEPLQLVCQTGNEVGKVYWYINDAFYKTASAGNKLFFQPEEGPVKISCTDDKGRNRDIWIRVRMVD
ncbi:penicillin-binding protein 1C [Flavihumibacter petaseus]|uniref:peptidoglycan glycosyltransferase n=1 Tax=Flavihumibacter petaseus NBRC 106054 TaxID=1220578 RepID=A0A0E9MXU3_9BACT|nr:penicillin-binding protein 1C [Flavihumibacter petaseus]GAO42537.1 penicillin-binding protein 1C [Flavihumibacter petaseus NBRC 106054]